MNLVLRSRVDQRATTCVVCRDADGVLAVCRGCGTTTHAGCATGSQGCPTIGCVRRDPLPVARWADQNVDLRASGARLRSSATRRALQPSSRLDLLTRPLSNATLLRLLAAPALVLLVVGCLVYRRLP